MANTLFAIKDGIQPVGQDDIEVYIDLDTVSRVAPSFSVPAEASTGGDFISASEGFLSSFCLSGYTQDGNDDRIVEEISVTGWDWVRSADIKRILEQSGVSAEEFTPGNSIFVADLVFSCISSGSPVGREFTPQTVNALSSAVYASASAYAAKISAEQYKWRYKVSKLVNVNAVKNSLRQIFTWQLGERIINPEFGSDLKKYLYEPITDENQERIVAEIRQCVLQWEPRVVIDRVVRTTQVDDIENNTVKLNIYYRIRGLNNQQFMYQYEQSRSKYSYI